MKQEEEACNVYTAVASLHVGAFLECVVGTVPTHTAVPMAENTQRVSLEKGNEYGIAWSLVKCLIHSKP